MRLRSAVRNVRNMPGARPRLLAALLLPLIAAVSFLSGYQYHDSV